MRRKFSYVVIGELGRYPLYLEVLLNMNEYWARLAKYSILTFYLAK
ncbi:hypothetical protein BAZSYMA_ACONTIG186503_3 [Bathymodiolus azoricus thioautotrophic gill symbiont]|uniref:Uncharacterized protein n=1 Tax=Bathymodiolus azoricus thioautotrophic gill symbiont TaxID=235205 RepID=A0A1H6KBZ3_9GAMM|nr:hypothetical protein BAZSYMA_ACONTIG186503_3 [Bathymodiolus azoricus thioautotrophic gill symbiont]